LGLFPVPSKALIKTGGLMIFFPFNSMSYKPGFVRCCTGVQKNDLFGFPAKNSHHLKEVLHPISHHIIDL